MTQRKPPRRTVMVSVPLPSQSPMSTSSSGRPYWKTISASEPSRLDRKKPVGGGVTRHQWWYIPKRRSLGLVRVRVPLLHTTWASVIRPPKAPFPSRLVTTSSRSRPLSGQ